MKSKRLWVMIGAMATNYWLINQGIGSTDLIQLATAVLMINGPVFAYMGVETYRPSQKKNENQ